MPDEVPWTRRTFDFGFPAGLRHPLLERLRGTPARAEELARPLPDSLLRRRDGQAWSIQEHLAHLADLEALFAGRLDDLLADRTTLRPADMTNRLTNEARHNDRAIDEVLGRLRDRRAELVARLEVLADDDFSRAAHHPRLDRPMRVVDMMLFHAEHDDHHLARARRLIRRLTPNGYNQPVLARLLIILKAINRNYALVVFWIYVLMFVFTCSMIFIFPPGALVMVFVGLGGLIIAVIGAQMLKGLEYLVARLGVSRPGPNS